jgi:hypothetical protein
MSFKDCIASAVSTGKLSQKKADEAAAAYDEAANELRQQGVGEESIDFKAAQAALEQTTKLKAADRWRRLNEMRKGHAIYSFLNKSNDPAADLIKLMDKVDLAHERLQLEFTAIINQVLAQYHPRAGGILHPTDNMDNVLRAMFGEKTGDEAADQMGLALSDMLNYIEKRANSEGASIPHNESRYAPQTHDRIKVKAYTRDEWVEDHLARADWERMKYEGKEIPPSKRREVLEHMRDGIVTNGFTSTRMKAGQGREASTATRLQRDRFLYYKDADAWLEMQKKYGHGNIIQQVYGLIDAMAKDISTMEVLGPSPASMKEFAKNAARIRAGDMDIVSGKAIKGKTETKKAEEAAVTFDRMYQIHNRYVVNGDENLMAQTIGALRTLSVSAQLGSVFVPSVIGDLSTVRWARQFYGLPTTHLVTNYLARYGDTAEERMWLLRNGVIWESAMSGVTSTQRYFGPLDGAHWAHRMSDITYRVGLTSAHTQNIRFAEGMKLTGFFADAAKQRFEDTRFYEAAREFGLTSEDWDAFRATPLEAHNGATFLRPLDMIYGATNAKERRIGEKWQDFMQQYMRMAVPSVSLRARAFLGHQLEPTSALGQFVRTMTSFTTFPTSIYFNQLRSIWRAPRLRDKLWQTVWFMGWLTAGGALITQAKALLNGDNLYNMNPLENPEFWGRAFVNGGSLGMLGDFLFNNINITNSDYSPQSAPLIDYWTKLEKLALNDPYKYFTGDKKNLHPQKDLVNFVNANLPRFWYSKLLIEREMEDQYLEHADPAAFAAKRRYARKIEQGMWWEPGQDPRTPDLNTAFSEQH